MPLKNYTNNNSDRQPTNTTYSSISFSNPESKIMPSKFSISYFNRLMKISIALRNNAGSKDAYATYDTDNQVSVYVSYSKAYMLLHLIEKLKQPDINNVCIELKNGLLKISKGAEFSSNNYCISISYADEGGNVNEVVYETKGDYHTAAYNYSGETFSTEVFKTLEVDTIAMALDEYYRASSYAIAASVMEAQMYKRLAQYELIKSIAEKVGVTTPNKQTNTKTFLNASNSVQSSSNEINGVPKYYDVTTFDSIAENM